MVTRQLADDSTVKLPAICDEDSAGRARRATSTGRKHGSTVQFSDAIPLYRISIHATILSRAKCMNNLYKLERRKSSSAKSAHTVPRRKNILPLHVANHKNIRAAEMPVRPLSLQRSVRLLHVRIHEPTSKLTQRPFDCVFWFRQLDLLLVSRPCAISYRPAETFKYMVEDNQARHCHISHQMNYLRKVNHPWLLPHTLCEANMIPI
nr:hypothetical protein CFP56_13231 [Quercus suber]